MVRGAVSFGLLAVGNAELYCPSAGDLMVAYGSADLHDGGWTIHGGGGAATKTAFNLIGGYVEYDMDVTGSQTGVIPNIYSVSPSGLGGGGFTDDASQYCDDGGSRPYCMEIDWIEANGNCGGATTIHTSPGTGDDGCTSWGCRTEYNINSGGKFHMKVMYDGSGKMSLESDGVQWGDFNDDPDGHGAWGAIKDQYTQNGAVIYSSQWTGDWVPAAFCGGGPGNLDGSSFSISNLRISGSVVQGPEPTKCSGPQPTPTPSPTPSPSPGGTCQTFVGKNNDGTNLKSTADITSSADACCSKCSESDGCVGYTWVHDNSECWLKSAVSSPRDDECGGCVTSGTYTAPAPAPTPTPTPTPTPSPTPSPSGCPGGSLQACVAGCPTDASVFAICVQECSDRCSGSDSCTGGDDGDSLETCMKGCPSDKFTDCVTCCTGKFPSFLFA